MGGFPKRQTNHFYQQSLTRKADGMGGGALGRHIAPRAITHPIPLMNRYPTWLNRKPLPIHPRRIPVQTVETNRMAVPIYPPTCQMTTAALRCLAGIDGLNGTGVGKQADRFDAFGE